MKRKILLLDDEPQIRLSVQERLQLEGYEVQTASDGRLGLKLYLENPADLVITDVLMPEMDGLEVIRALRGMPSSPYIIAMSGGGSRNLDFLVEACEFGATRTLSKPFLLEDLILLVHDLLSTASPLHPHPEP